MIGLFVDVAVSNIEEEVTQTIPAPKRIKKDSLVSRKPLRAQRTGTNSQTIVTVKLFSYSH